jgi:uncharacterized damage-inducible protein DinB
MIRRPVEALPIGDFEKTVGGSFGSIKAVIIHLLESDWLWMNRFKGIPLAQLPAWNFANVQEIYNAWDDVQAQTLAALRDLSKIPDAKIDFVTRKGGRYQMPWEEIVVHISNHGTYHRGQITHMLRDLRANAVSTDYFIFYNMQ